MRLGNSGCFPRNGDLIFTCNTADSYSKWSKCGQNLLPCVLNPIIFGRMNARMEVYQGHDAAETRFVDPSGKPGS
jgi:hypothetical protein